MKIQTRRLDGNSGAYQINHYPSECPVCHTSISPGFISAIEILPEDRQIRLQLAFQCTAARCRCLFIANYRGATGQTINLLKTAPLSPVIHSFPEEIEETSQMFVEIYNQVAAADSSNLDQLVGIGLRKALEFLIKDYAISQKPEEKDNIEKEFLSICIKKYIDDPRIKQCAKFASWLGNDEAHYIRKWEEKDINDLKTLITLTVNWIHSTLLTKKYASDMGCSDTKQPQ